MEDGRVECNFRCPGGGVGYPIDNIESHQCLLILLIDRQSDGFGWGGGGPWEGLTIRVD